MPTAELSDEDFADGSIDILTLLHKSGLVASKSEGRRAVQQGGVAVDGEKVSDISATFAKADFEGEGKVEIKAEELKDNPFDLIGKQWMLITAGNEEKCNTMTASWGGVGIMWGKPTATAYIRDSRYTKEFVDREDYFTLAFFGEEHREALNLCGRVSGRDEDKIKEAGLTPYYVDGTVAFEEAKMIFVCKKVYVQRMGEENFVEKANLDKWYADKDMHNMYMGEIKKILVKED